jgi:hypothetical protein
MGRAHGNPGAGSAPPQTRPHSMAYARNPMAPPKRKTGGGRVTPKGTRPEDRYATPSSKDASHDHHEVAASSRYTPKATPKQLVPPNWIPVIMLVLLIGGGLMIMARYLIFTDSNIPTLVGLVMILGGLYTATKWR